MIASHGGEVLNSKSEWHQAKIVKTTTRVLQGGADVLAQLGGGRQGGQGPAAGQGPRTPATRTQGHIVCSPSIHQSEVTRPSGETCLLIVKYTIIQTSQVQNRHLTRKAGVTIVFCPTAGTQDSF